MSVKHIGLVLDHFDAAPAIKLVAIILADHADNDGLCWPSYRRIAQRANMSERTVRRHIKELQDLGIITKLRTGHLLKTGDKVQRISNAYRVNAHIIQGRKTLKLSTNRLGISDTDDHLEVDKSRRSRWSAMTTKPSMNHHSNHQHSKPVDNSGREPISLDDMLAQIMVDPNDA